MWLAVCLLTVCATVVRELLRLGAEVVMVGNTMPAINDITVTELVSAVEDIAGFCPTIKVCSQQNHTLCVATMSHSQCCSKRKYRA